MNALRAVPVAFAIGVGASAHASEDWLDDMPSVAAVARVAQQDVGPVYQQQDRVATRVAMTLLLLRQLMAYEAAAEPAMSAQRRDRFTEIEAAYLQAELAIGRGLGHRKGGLSAADVYAFTESRRHEPCVTDACYAYWFSMQLENWGNYDFRLHVVPLLFPCERAIELLDLAQKNALTAPLVPQTPALTRTLPDAVRRSTANVAGSCGVDGDDVDGDKSCYDWEADLLALASSSERVEPSCKPLQLISATTTDAESVTVKYVIGPGFGRQPVRLQTCRAAKRPVTTCTAPVGVSLGVDVLSSPRDLAVGPHEVTIAKGKVLKPDPRMPYVVVLADSVGQTSQTWFQKHLVGVLVHGYAFSKRVAAGKFVDELLAAGNYEKFVEWAMRELVLDDDALADWQAPMEASLESVACYDPATFAFQWKFDSTLEVPSILTARAREMYRQVVAVVKGVEARHAGDVVDLHFIGHSRGTVMVSQALLEWKTRPDPALRGSYLKVTLLDPHPANNVLSPQESIRDEAVEGTCYRTYKEIQTQIKDPLVTLPDGIGLREATVWFQQTPYLVIQGEHGINPTDDDYACPLNLWGRGASMDNVVNESRAVVVRKNLTGFRFAGGRAIDHSGVVALYQALLDKGAGGHCVPPPG